MATLRDCGHHTPAARHGARARAQNPNGDTAELLRTFWKRLDDPSERRQFLLLAEIYGLALRDRDRYAKVLEVLAQDLRAPIETSLRGDGVAPAGAAALATALLALIRGLQFDLAAAGDRARVDAAFGAALDALLTTSAVSTAGTPSTEQPRLDS
ncbi:hypothetical protein GCM10023321_12630 [Pseudonocardia eucalypti]|uniref:BetI-type transcriptional repressor C-terminal domain-containing protein n=1 Tax=Pseudonocardia eucalypti TaxID=648755 RepID=A0ABP9PMR9_9PSEU|nr:hypothetical protein [Pseudonocardia eucalypti]